MPNHCFNKVTISVGDADGQNLKVLVDTLKSEENQTDFDFNAILPMPPELENVGWSEAEEMNDIIRARYKKEHGSDNWYDWRVNNWGTKWNSYELFFRRGGGRLCSLYIQYRMGSPNRSY